MRRSTTLCRHSASSCATRVWGAPLRQSLVPCIPAHIAEHYPVSPRHCKLTPIGKGSKLMRGAAQLWTPLHTQQPILSTRDVGRHTMCCAHPHPSTAAPHLQWQPSHIAHPQVCVHELVCYDAANEQARQSIHHQQGTDCAVLLGRLQQRADAVHSRLATKYPDHGGDGPVVLGLRGWEQFG